MSTLTCICCHTILPEDHMLRLFGDPICRVCSSTVTIGRAIVQPPPFDPPNDQNKLDAEYVLTPNRKR